MNEDKSGVIFDAFLNQEHEIEEEKGRITRAIEECGEEVMRINQWLSITDMLRESDGEDPTGNYSEEWRAKTERLTELKKSIVDLQAKHSALVEKGRDVIYEKRYADHLLRGSKPYKGKLS